MKSCVCEMHESWEHLGQVSQVFDRFHTHTRSLTHGHTCTHLDKIPCLFALRFSLLVTYPPAPALLHFTSLSCTELFLQVDHSLISRVIYETLPPL